MTWRVTWSTTDCIDCLEEFQNLQDAALKFDKLQECDGVICILLFCVIDDIFYFIDKFERNIKL